VEARDLLIAAKKRSLGFEGGVGAKNKGPRQSCRVGHGLQRRRRPRHAGRSRHILFVPREGSEIWLDNLAVPARAPHRGMAEKFINYILDPKIGAQVANFNQYATPNKAALEFIKPEDLKIRSSIPHPT